MEIQPFFSLYKVRISSTNIRLIPPSCLEFIFSPDFDFSIYLQEEEFFFLLKFYLLLIHLFFSFYLFLAFYSKLLS